MATFSSVEIEAVCFVVDSVNEGTDPSDIAGKRILVRSTDESLFDFVSPSQFKITFLLLRPVSTGLLFAKVAILEGITLCTIPGTSVSPV